MLLARQHLLAVLVVGGQQLFYLHQMSGPMWGHLLGLSAVSVARKTVLSRSFQSSSRGRTASVHNRVWGALELDNHNALDFLPANVGIVHPKSGL